MFKNDNNYLKETSRRTDIHRGVERLKIIHLGKNRLRCPLVRLSGLQGYNMDHNGHGINLYGVIMTLMGNLHAREHSNMGHLDNYTNYTNYQIVNCLIDLHVIITQ